MLRVTRHIRHRSSGDYFIGELFVFLFGDMYIMSIFILFCRKRKDRKLKEQRVEC